MIHELDDIVALIMVAEQDDRRTQCPAHRGNLRRRSIVVVISDFYETVETIVGALGLLRGSGNDVIAFHLLDEAELSLPFEDASEFEDLESGRRLPVLPEAVREEYRERVLTHIDTLRSRLSEGGIDYYFMNTSTPLDFALFNYLSNRQKAAIVR